MGTDDPRKEYWNKEYYLYWKSRVDEAGDGCSSVVQGDPNTTDLSIYQEIFSRNGFEAGNILDIGCAWGRMFPIYLKHNLQVTGSDISAAMINVAMETWSNDHRIRDLIEAPAEQLPFDTESFDNVACLATFDATFQDQALNEMLRVSRPGARIFFTGKNDTYFCDDDPAYKAEVGALRKGHPNYFTNTRLMLELLRNTGHQINDLLIFPRRGDFPKLNHERELLPQFYEYMIVLTRGPEHKNLPEFSSSHSCTYLKRHGQ